MLGRSKRPEKAAAVGSVARYRAAGWHAERAPARASRLAEASTTVVVERGLLLPAKPHEPAAERGSGARIGGARAALHAGGAAAAALPLSLILVADLRSRWTAAKGARRPQASHSAAGICGSKFAGWTLG